jgi:hypothetical protein
MKALLLAGQSTSIEQWYDLANDAVNENRNLCAKVDELERRLTVPVELPTILANQENDSLSAFLNNLKRSRDKYPKNNRMFDGLNGEINELRLAYAGDGNITAEALDVAVIAFRIATEGDAGGNELINNQQPSELSASEKFPEYNFSLPIKTDDLMQIRKYAIQDNCPDIILLLDQIDALKSEIEYRGATAGESDVGPRPSHCPA